VLRPALRRAGALRRSVRDAKVGLATVTGTHGYVAVQTERRTLSFQPVRELGGRWWIDGVLEPSGSG
jgi:hypothetical protein